MRYTNDKDTYETLIPQVNNAKLTKTKSTLHNKIIFKDELTLPPHSSFHILSHRIEPDRTLNGSNITGRQGTSNRNLKICLVNTSITNNNNNAITVVKAINGLMKVINCIKVDSNKVKIASRKSKQPNLEVLKYIKGGKYPEAEVGKYTYAFREGQYRKGRQYVMIQLSVAHDMTW